MESKAVVSLTNGKKAFGDNEVLKDISLTVNAGPRAAASRRFCVA